MDHQTIKNNYSQLVDRLNRFPQSAPPSKLLNKILSLLFTDKEAGLVSLLPIKPFTVNTAARIWKMNRTDARKILNKLSSHALLSELFYQYLNVEDKFIKELFTLGETQLERVFVHEPALSDKNALHVLDFERAAQVIETASHIGIRICSYRHKMQHVGKDCANPKNICMTLNTSAASLIKHVHVRQVDKSEGLEYLHKAYEHNLVQFGENVKERVNFICNCCGCCCEAIIAARRFGVFNPVHTSNFLPQIDLTACYGCGKCVNICPVEAMTFVSATDPLHPKQKEPKLDEKICLGCGV
jgi:ferredoxin